MNLLGYLFGICTHPHTSWPMKGYQTCPDCGKRRKYKILKTGIKKGGPGVDIGPWESATKKKLAPRKARRRFVLLIPQFQRRTFMKFWTRLFLALVTISTWSVAQDAVQPQCDATLWQHVYHGRFHTAKNRLRVIKPCVTVTGTLTLLRIEKDGDAHYRLNLDSQFKSMLLPANAQQHHMLVVEQMCVRPPTQRDTVKEGVCKNFSQEAGFSGRVSVTGAYVQDMEHGWAEIHPVTKITKQ